MAESSATVLGLALVTIMQFAEGLSDRQAADAVRSRIDWRYALGLELTDPGFDTSVLTEFRTRLLNGQPEQLLLDKMLERLRERKLLKARGRMRTNSTDVLAAVRSLNRLECVGETLHHALNTLASVAPDWLHSWVPSSWFERYGRRFEECRLPPGREERYALAAQIGVDGRRLLEQIYEPNTPSWRREIPAVQTLRQAWLQQFVVIEGQLQWRQAADLPPSGLLIHSPYDVEARFSKKRQTEGQGYKVHLTETCDADLPHLITNVETTISTVTDYEMTAVIHRHLAQRELLPAEHLVDSGYRSAEQLVASAKQGIDLVGPVTEEKSWQAKAADAYDIAAFSID